MKKPQSVFVVTCCYILLNFVIGIRGSTAADTEAATSNKIPEALRSSKP